MAGRITADDTFAGAMVAFLNMRIEINWAGFTPCAVEWDFSSQYGRPLPFTLPSGKRISFRGRIDRLGQQWYADFRYRL